MTVSNMVEYITRAVMQCNYSRRYAYSVVDRFMPWLEYTVR